MFTAILNYNEDTHAMAIRSALLAEYEHGGVVIVDSSGVDKPGFIKSDKPFYTGNFNKACELFLKSNEDRCLIVCADIVADYIRLSDKIKKLPDCVGVYTPAVLGKSFDFEKPVGNGLRQIQFAEGMILCISREIIQEIYPIEHNTYGWGVDMFVGYVCRNMGHTCVVDNDITVYHPFGKAYSGKKARTDMRRYIRYMGRDFKRFCRSTKIGLPFVPRMIMRIKNLL